MEGIPAAKVAHFAGEARVGDAAEIRKVGAAKRTVLIVSLLHQARVRARDEVAAMFCKRMAGMVAPTGLTTRRRRWTSWCSMA